MADPQPPNHPNVFIQDAIVITTYDFAADNEETAKVVHRDLTVFEDANALSPVYQEDNKQAKTLKRIAGDSFKLLLTGTPIEKNIMDLYGLIWFIDETLLPGEKEFLARYLRRPENYPELSEEVSRYCFRTLRSQAKHYAKVTERVLLTVFKQGFPLMKKTGAKQKAVIFTETVETQKMLLNLLSAQYRTLAYNGSADYSVIRQFKEDGEVLISTDEGTKGMIHQVKLKRTDLDMIYEIMLKLGVPLTYSVIPFSINGKTVYDMSDDCLLLVCLAEDVQPEDVEQMTEYAPAKIIISVTALPMIPPWPMPITSCGITGLN